MDTNGSTREPAEAIKTPPTPAERNVQVAAAIATAMGLRPIPVRARSKRPEGDSWPKKVFETKDFAPTGNIGLHLTTASRIVDADLDSEYARRLAPKFLPATEMKYGRTSKPT